VSNLVPAPQGGNSLANQSGTALAKQGSESWRDPDWQRLWLAIEKQPWKTLSLVPAGDGAEADFTLTLAVALSRTGMSHLGEPVVVADGTAVALEQLSDFIADLQECTAQASRLIVALPPITSSPTAPTIAKATDASVLCVLLEKMSWAQARSTLKIVGANRFLGSVIIRRDGSLQPPPPK
jgi:hypothetical protein